MAPPEAETPVLRIWGGASDVNGIMNFADQFAEAHGNVDFEPNPMAGDQRVSLGRLGLESNSLDIFLTNTGWTEGDPLIRAGLILSLEEYWSQYNWDDRFTEYGKDNASYEGSPYWIPHNQSFIAYMYNAEVFRKHGLTGEEDPQTYDEYIEILQVLKDGGEKPLISGLRGASGQTDHIWAPYVQAAVGKGGMEDIIYGDGKWTDERLLDGTQRMVSLADQGFLDPDGLGLDYTEAQGRLNEGKNAVWTSGVWALGPIGDALGVENFGFMTVPPSMVWTDFKA